MTSRPQNPDDGRAPASPGLRFWVAPGRGLHYEVDLREFAEGGRGADLRAPGQAGWSGDFRGRPCLAAQIATLFRLEPPSASSESTLRAGLRCLLRFLDVTDRGVAGVGHLTDAHGVGFLRWTEGAGASHYYGSVRTAVGRMRELEGCPPLVWPARGRNVPPLLDDVDQPALRRLFHAFRHEARAVKAMFAEGERLARSGRDPRGAPFGPGMAESAWDDRRNHAWLVEHLTGQRLPPKAEILKRGGRGLNQANRPEQRQLGPAYLAPGMTERGRDGIVGKLRWFHPSYHDTAIYLWLVVLGTGWNLATCLALDVSNDAGWVSDHPYKSAAKLLHAFKARAGRKVFAYSATEPEFHPYRIVRYMITRTAPLRETLRHRLAAEQERCATAPSPAAQAEIERLRQALRSPWLYHVVNAVGAVNCFASEDSAKLNRIARIVAQRAGLMERHPALAAMTTTVARDGWMAHAYDQSGYSVVMAQLAGQHADARSLLHYLRRRRYRTHSERTMRRVQDASFSEIAARRPLDPTRLRLLVEAGGITPTQEKRLLDHRMRTRLGMGCLDPTHPPRHLAPDHREGSLCRIQRCTGCRHGVVFQDSLGPLARRRAELLELQRTLPFAVWAQSPSFGEELRSIELTLETFAPEEVRVETEAWSAKLRTGEVAVHDTYPL
ncbi:hypothetical protein ASF53_16840 [Methylobacterium sp. Leaf123]|uniref:hypothetical protein n=1 Tax=Methylobacterium sp. Leaf123 TaxID=1736264 RepID=UPI0006F8DE97|nr:hypothetical protein [Methylobacterium sp. Leaf123]KQQ11828.1 hypothetical protein ASF53_16840 [Methylobacterium sp. Leaf123]